jgi:hypothetical protein
MTNTRSPARVSRRGGATGFTGLEGVYEIRSSSPPVASVRGVRGIFPGYFHGRRDRQPGRGHFAFPQRQSAAVRLRHREAGAGNRGVGFHTGCRLLHRRPDAAAKAESALGLGERLCLGYRLVHHPDREPLLPP